MKKSQYSLEFLIFFALLTVILSIWLVIYLNLNEQALDERNRLAVMDLGKSIQIHLKAASDSHSGYRSRRLFIPQKAGPYTVEIYNSNYTFSLRTAKGGDIIFNTPFMVGDLKKGRYNTLWNVDGIVCIADDSCIVNPDGTITFP
ncbi:MAG: hypothetical protein KAK00_00920 [Nanoarchaeota archaeon]|nr:hypothetical protein [Nanoarchaeota archaeon]